ncbi:MAG: amidohydrolase family protein, partial [Gammaproteobacteria bacterium]|nr:amidohydrolase family protein [Gammaproteobacteria bacterium]
EQDIHLNPTLVYEWGGMSRDANQREIDDYLTLRDPDLIYFPNNIKLSLFAKHRQIKNFSTRYGNLPMVNKLPEADRLEFEKGFENIREFMRRWMAAGGKVQAGTDAITAGVPGLGLHQEMRMLVETGLTPMQAIKSATRWSAEQLEGIDGRRGAANIGSIEPGKYADLVVLEENPLVDIYHSRSVSRVMKEGEWLELGYHPEYYTFTRPSRSIAGSIFAPIISAVFPSYVVAGGENRRIALEGSGFQMTTLVRVNGISVKTEFINPKRVEFDLPASLFARATPDPYRSPGPYQENHIVGFRGIEIHAFNPPPEGGVSNTINLMVRPD